MPGTSDPVWFMTTIKGSATAAWSEPIEMSTSPAMKTMATPIPAIIASDAWPRTLVRLRTVKKYGEARPKNAMMTRSARISANSFRRVRIDRTRAAGLLFPEVSSALVTGDLDGCLHRGRWLERSVLDDRGECGSG